MRTLDTQGRLTHIGLTPETMVLVTVPKTFIFGLGIPDGWILLSDTSGNPLVLTNGSIWTEVPDNLDTVQWVTPSTWTGLSGSRVIGTNGRTVRDTDGTVRIYRKTTHHHELLSNGDLEPLTKWEPEKGSTRHQISPRDFEYHFDSIHRLTSEDKKHMLKWDGWDTTQPIPAGSIIFW